MCNVEGNDSFYSGGWKLFSKFQAKFAIYVNLEILFDYYFAFLLVSYLGEHCVIMTSNESKGVIQFIRMQRFIFLRTEKVKMLLSCDKIL